MTSELLTGSKSWLTDSGLETDLIFNHGVELPDFAAFPLVEDPRGEEVLRTYFREHIKVAAEKGHGVVVETPTWRASPDWGQRLGYDLQGTRSLEECNRRAVELVQSARSDVVGAEAVLVSGCLGPRGDGYSAADRQTTDSARDYHSWQAGVLADAGVDLVSALTMTHVEEAVGITQAAVAAGVDVVISFTVETDGRLPDGTPLGDALSRVDEETDGAPAYFMVNCAHPDHIRGAVDGGAADSFHRLRGVRANASRLSHAELDEAEELDAGNPQELAGDLLALRTVFPQLNVLGGCCGTDLRHISALADAWQ